MLKACARLLLRVGGWEAIGGIPDAPKAVVIAAPHTSNWDGFWALVYKVSIGMDIHFFAKQSLFWFPLGKLLRGLGGIPLDRSRATSAVAQAVAMFDASTGFYFGLAPEGTRALRDGWKTGFHRIATEAGVPVYLGVLDYKTKRIGIADRLDLSGDTDADLRKCEDFYSKVVGRWPERTSPVRFVE